MSQSKSALGNKRTPRSVEVERHDNNRQQPQDAIEPADSPMDPIPRLRKSRFFPFPAPRQGVQEVVKNIDREERYAIEHERLERVRANLGIDS